MLVGGNCEGFSFFFSLSLQEKKNKEMARGVTTEWEDIQVKMGNWTPVEKGPTTDEIF